MLGFPLLADQWRAALRTRAREGDGLREQIPRGRRVAVDAHNLGNDLSAFFDQHGIAFTEVESGHLIGVVKRCIFDGGPAQQNWLQIGDWGHRPRPAHLVFYALQRGAHTLGLKLVGQGPTRALRRHAQTFLLVVSVHLDDQAVNGKIQIASRFLPMGHRIHDCLHAGDHFQTPALGRFETPIGSLAHGLAVRGDAHGSHGLCIDVVDHAV